MALRSSDRGHRDDRRRVPSGEIATGADTCGGDAAAVGGLGFPGLRLAAGAEGEDSPEQRATFALALEELDQLPLGADELAARFTTFWAQRVVRGEVEPLVAAQELWVLARNYGVQFSDDSIWAWGALDADEYAGPGVQEAYEHDIREAASRWLATRQR